MDYSLGYMPHIEGAWNNYTDYTPMAIVTNYGTSYISKVAVSAGTYEPGETAGWGNYWQIFAEGVQGYQGQRGVQGYTGTQGAQGNIGPAGTGTQGSIGAQGVQGPAGSGSAIDTTPFFQVGNFIKLGKDGATHQDITIDKMGGGEFYVIQGTIRSLKLTNVQVGAGQTCAEVTSGNLGEIICNKKSAKPTFVYVDVDTDILLTASNLDYKFLTVSSPNQLTHGNKYLLVFFGNIMLRFVVTSSV